MEIRWRAVVRGVAIVVLFSFLGGQAAVLKVEAP